MRVVVYNNLNEWIKITENFGHQSILNNIDFINITCNTFNVDPFVSIVFQNEVPILGSVLYEKGNRIIQPNEYFYTSIWINSKSELIVQECVLFWLTFLTKKFKKVEFSLPPNFKDIRPFYWCGFKADVYFTYLNSIDNALNFKSNIQNKINKSKNHGIYLNVDTLANDEIIQYHYNSFINLGYSKEYSNEIACFADRLIKKGLGYAIYAKYSDATKIVASSIMILDEYKHSAINFLVSSNKTSYQTGVHSALYAENFFYLKSKEIKSIDLCGANTKGIGNFKGNFKGELTPFYRVKFNYWRWQAVLGKRKFDKLVSMLRKKLR